MKRTIINFTQQEMLAYWRMHLNLDPARHGAAITRTDGTDLDAQLLQRISEWYAAYLASAPIESLPSEDVKNRAAVKYNDDFSVELSLPTDAIAPVAVKLRSWAAPVTVFHSPSSPEAHLQLNPYLRGRSAAPVAVAYPDRLVLYSAASMTDRLELLIAAVRPPQGTFILDEASLASIPDRLW